MSQQKNYIIFQCYGNEGIFHECTYALLSLSLLYQPEELNNTEIWIYTDNPAWFRSFKDCPLPLHYREINNITIKEWRGKIDFVHRVKIEMLKDFTRDKTANVLYADTDVVFTHRIDKMLEHIGAGKLYMHTLEGKVSDEGSPVLRKLNKYLSANAKQDTNGKPLNELSMWNAGVLGFNTQYNHLLEKILAFTDSEYPHFPKHIIEQFACSTYFQEARELKAASPFILHYWNLKEARQSLASFFDAFKGKSWQELTNYSQLLQMPVLMQEKANFYQNRSIMDKLLKKQWLPSTQNWLELIKQL